MVAIADSENEQADTHRCVLCGIISLAVTAVQPRLTILSPLPPYPAHAGGTAHILQATRQLARFFRVSLYALAADPATVTWGPLDGCCAEVGAFQATPRLGLSLDPPAVRLEYSSALVKHLQKVWAREAPRIVQVEFTSMAQYAPLARSYGARVVCTMHNLAFLAQARRARRETSRAMRLRRWVGMLSLWAYELRALRRCDLVVAHGAADALVLRRWLPGLRVEHVPSGIDLAQWPACFDPRADDEVLFVGNYLHPPNLEGALWLAGEVWPLVRRARPNARLTLAGRAPPPELQRVAGPGVRVPGTVDDLRPLYAAASLVVAPIFWGGGVRVKILEALACGLPLVTTRLAAEGIGLIPEQSALFAEQPGDFAGGVVRLLGNRQLRNALGTAGRRLIERDYDWEQIGERLAALYANMLQ